MAKRSSSFRACLIVTFAVGMVLVLVVVVLVSVVVVLDARRKRLRISNVGTGPINIFWYNLTTFLLPSTPRLVRDDIYTRRRYRS